jgi:dTMP kinase
MRWIVIDGIDGSGKSTAAEWARELFEERGERVLIQNHPSDRLIGRVTKRLLLGTTKVERLFASVFFMVDVIGSLRRLKGRWKGYDTVIFVRYLMATAYLPASLVRAGYGFFAHLLPVPDRLILVDIEPKVAIDRIEERDEEREMFEDIESLQRVRGKVNMVASGEWEVLDNSGTMEQTRERLERLIDGWEG